MPAGSRPTIWWVRRDLRLADQPALLAAVDSGPAVLPLFVLDPVLLGRAGPVRRAWLSAALVDLDDALREGGGPGLSVLAGSPGQVLPAVAQRAEAGSVHISADFGPYGRSRDAAVSAALADLNVPLRATGSPYAVAPGTLRTRSDSPFAVFTPFHRAWSAHGVHGPAPAVPAGTVSWLAADRRQPLATADPELVQTAGERAARLAWRDWLARADGGPADYRRLHNRPDADATAHISVALRWGHLHPRTVLADLAEQPSPGAAAIARQVAWRDFYADVLWHRPGAVSRPLRSEFTRMERDDPATSELAADRLTAWQQGRTGYPLVDAGMRQLLAQGWMHNRVRLVVASFLVKDLHLGWEHGAAWFMARLRDGDLASNQLNWQWVAGCGNDAAPYYRVFNPTGQAEKFDPDGRYIRRYVPELAGLANDHLYTPWAAPGGPPPGYPHPIVEHAQERREALERYQRIRSDLSA